MCIYIHTVFASACVYIYSFVRREFNLYDYIVNLFVYTYFLSLMIEIRFSLVRECVCVCVCLFIDLSVCLSVCMCVGVCACLRYVCIYIDVCIYIYIYICMYVCIYS